jgi:hypothetical protein
VETSGAFSGVAWANVEAAGTNREQRIKRILSFIGASFLTADAKQ